MENIKVVSDNEQQRLSTIEQAKKQATEGMRLVGQQTFIRMVYDALTLKQKTSFTIESILALLQKSQEGVYNEQH